MVKRHIPGRGRRFLRSSVTEVTRWSGARRQRRGGNMTATRVWFGRNPHGILITWALMMEGGYRSTRGENASQRTRRLFEQCVNVLAQPGRVARNIYDERRHRLGLEFRLPRCRAAGAIKTAPDLGSLATLSGLPAENLTKTVARASGLAAGQSADPFGRDFTGKPALHPPYYAVKVTGSLFHTQGGLVVTPEARVCDGDGRPFPNLFAGGGAARGISGAHVWGYLSGNGLLSAVGLGWIAGRVSARLALGSARGTT